MGTVRIHCQYGAQRAARGMFFGGKIISNSSQKQFLYNL